MVETTTTRYLLLPGWLDSGPSHWQSRWETLHGCERVLQDDWVWPRRGDWMARLECWAARRLELEEPLVLAGDYNIAPDDRDVHDPKAWAGQILCSEPERSAFQRLRGLGLSDSFRLFEQPEKTFSWWDYRMLGFQKNLGLRIDHVLLSPPLAAACSAR